MTAVPARRNSQLPHLPRRHHHLRIAAGVALSLTLGAFNADATEVNPLVQLLAQSPPGAVITVPAGVYSGSLRIDKPVTLIGNPGTIVDAAGKGDVVRIAASDVTLRNLTLRHSGTDLTATDAGVFVERQAHNVVIEGNTLSDVLFGIYLDGPSGVQVLDNRITGMPERRSADRGDGIHLWNDAEVLVKGNDISLTRDGIYIYVSPHNRIVGNHIHDLRYGIHYMYSNHDLIAGNQTHHTRAGYALMQSDHLRVFANQSDDDSDYGLLLNYVTYSELAGNVIRGVTGDHDEAGQAISGGEGKGIFVYNSEFNQFQNNTVRNCPIGIHITAGSEGNRIFDNAFDGNRAQVKYVQNIKEEWSWNGQGNYWSDYLGWDLDGDGRGDVTYRPNDGVDVLLWKYPGARLLMSSPAILVLRYIQRAFPVFMPPGVQDSHPLMQPLKTDTRAWNLADDERS